MGVLAAAALLLLAAADTDADPVLEPVAPAGRVELKQPSGGLINNLGVYLGAAAGF